ncbi:DUF5988 family protein [Nocardia brasiliensis]|uniref:DUF5988 family protein n=1 Tax=Nocardia brasiliensis TaxID=37326 RepID=UPI003410D2A1
MAIIVLKGCPNGMDRVQEIDGAEIPDRLTLDHCGRHVHFEREIECAVLDGNSVPVFRWIYTTAIAE